MEGHDHTVIVNYDKQKKKWIYIDTNIMGQEFMNKYYLELNSSLLAELVFHSFGCLQTSYIPFNITAVSNNNKSNAKLLFDSLHLKHLVLPKHAFRYDENGVGLLYIACQHGDIELVKKLLTQPGIDINRACNGCSPLYIACQHGYVDLVKELLKKPGVDINKARNGVTPLQLACQNGHVDIVKELLQQPGIDINSRATWGGTPLSADQYAPQQTRGIISLYLNIRKMEFYGISLLSHDEHKGQSVIKLAAKLLDKVDFFYSLQKISNDADFNEFSLEFKELLHSKDELMRKHRAAWKPILANILLALTGFGLLAIALKFSISIFNTSTSHTWNNSFFFSKTNRQKHIEQVEESLNAFPNSDNSSSPCKQGN